MSERKKRSHQDRTLEEKLKIVQYVNENPLMKKKTIAAHFGINPKTLSDLIKNSDKIRAQLSKGSSLSSSKRLRKSSQPEVDKALLIWFQQRSCDPQLRTDGPMLHQQARKFLAALSVDTLPKQTISKAWIDRWKKRHGFSRVKKAAGSGDADNKIVGECKDEKHKEDRTPHNVSIDNTVETSSDLTYEQITQVVMDPVVEGLIDNDGNTENKSQAAVKEELVPSINDAYAAIQTLQRYSLRCSCHEMDGPIIEIAGILMEQLLKCPRQSKTTN